MTGLGTQLARGIGSLFIVQLLSFPLSVATNLLAGQYLIPSDYGAFATAIFVVSLIGMLSDVSLLTVLIRNPEELTEGDYASVFSYQIAAGAALALVLAVGSFAIGSFFREYEIVSRMVLRLSVLPLVSAFLTIPLVKMERELHYGRIAGLSMFWQVTERLMLIGLILLGMKGFSYVYSRIGGVLLQALTLYWLVRWEPLALVKRVLQKGWHGARHLRFGFALQLKSASGPIGDSVIPGIGGRLFGVETVGLVAWSFNMASIVGLRLPQLAGKVFTGASSKLRDMRAFKEYFEMTLLLCTILVGTALAVLSAIMPELLLFLFKPSWHQAAPYFMIASLVMGCGVLYSLYDAQMVVLGYPMTSAKATWAWAITLFVSGMVLARALGPSGLLWAHLAGNLAPVVVLHAKARAVFPVEVKKNFAIPLLISVLIGLVAFQLKGFFIHGVSSLLAYMVIMAMLALALQSLAQPRLLKIARELIQGL